MTPRRPDETVTERIVVGDRFHIEGVAGKGAMGIVYRARDISTDAVVALKVVEGNFANLRFEREATLLAALEHHGIVRYVAHGETDGQMYLAMEWLDGVPLDERLKSGPLSPAESVAIAKTLARALGVAHARGIVHRDVKPSNVILRNGDPQDAVLIDFGIARSDFTINSMTATGSVVGTPAYMSPEQARGEKNLDARADVFSLACVLFECLAGRPPFTGEHVIAILAKILFEPAPRIRSLRSEIPSALDSLIASMLEKAPEDRPYSGDALAETLEAIDVGPALPERQSRPSLNPMQRGEAIGITERRFATILLARARKSAADTTEEDILAGVTDESAVADVGSAVGMSIVPLADGMFVGALVAANSGPDAPSRAARCALALRSHLPQSSVAIATGRAIVADHVPVGDAIDRAAHLLARTTNSIRIDEATASVIENRFEITHDPRGGKISLIRERAAVERTIMGRVVPFVGRDRELGMLEATYGECVDEPIARATLVIAPLGIGKTRLQRELVTRLSSSREEELVPKVWLGLADPVMDRAPLAFAGDVLRRVIGLTDNEPLADRREKILLRVRMAGHDARNAQRIASFLGELARVPFDEANDPTLRAARQSPELLASQMTDAFVAFVTGELKSSPILIVLEDLHWADAASLRLFSTLISRSKNRPLMIVGLARPSLDEVHPKLWDELRCQRIVLEPLLRRASERLVRAVLGDRPEVEAIVRRAEGNALFVEELARACAEGRALDDLPPTVVAATEARLAAFDTETRQVLRAAAVFGERFWWSGVAKLLGRTSMAIEATVRRLEELEVVSRAPESRFANEREYMFRHALVRDAAYAMLTDDDRRLGHALAAEWLETFELGDELADVLAVHFDCAGLWAKAARHGRKAAERAIRVSRFSEGLALLDRVKSWIERIPDGEEDEQRHAALVEVLLEQERVCDLMSHRVRQSAVLDELLSVLVRGRDDSTLAGVYARNGEFLAAAGRPDEARASLDLALELSRASSDLALERRAFKAKAFLAWQEGRLDDVITYNERVLELARSLNDSGYGRDLTNLGMNFVRLGELDRARACLEERETLQDESPSDRAHALHFRALYYAKLGDIDAEVATHHEAIAVQEESGLWAHRLITLDVLANAETKRGRFEEGLAALSALTDLARRIEFKPQLARALLTHGELLVSLGQIDDALPLFAESAEVWGELGNSEAALNSAEHAARAARGLPDASIAQLCYQRAIEIAHVAGERDREGDLLNTLAILHFKAGDFSRALEIYERALALFDSMGDRVHSVLVLNSIGATLLKTNEYRRAREHLERSVRLARATSERLLEGHAFALIGDSHRGEGDHAKAKASYEASLEIRRELGDRRGEGWMLFRLATVSLAMRDPSRAHKLRDEALRFAESCGDAELAQSCATLM